MNREERQRIVPLDDTSDFKVADGDPDVRGWDVVSADGRRIGKVDDLLVDPGAMRVRYLNVEVEKDLRASNDHRNILIPIGQASLNEKDDRVFVGSLSASDVRTFPAYEGRLDRDYENTVRSRFGGTGDLAAGSGATSGRTGSMSPAHDRDYYSDDHFDDSRFYGARRRGRRSDRMEGRGRDDREGSERMTLSEEELNVDRQRREAGSVHVNKHVETEHVSREVPVTREEAVIERRPIDGRSASGRDVEITDDEIRVPLHEEQAVVEKRTVPKEELVVRKREVQDSQTVEADLRKERADVEGEGDVSRDRDRNRNR
jgi:uncharacterized protein (TIGR02271 family)